LSRAKGYHETQFLNIEIEQILEFRASSRNYPTDIRRFARSAMLKREGHRLLPSAVGYDLPNVHEASVISFMRKYRAASPMLYAGRSRTSCAVSFFVM
jgi:hypothetical protein